VKEREEKDGLSEMGSVLPKNVVSCKNILLSASKSLPQRKQSPEGESSERAGALPGISREGSHGYDPLTTVATCICANS